jgi:dihydroorotase
MSEQIRNMKSNEDPFMNASSATANETPDLILKGGRVVDPSQGIDAILDVALRGDRIVKLAAAIDPAKARVIDVSGTVVTPGLIDLHVHVYRHMTDFGLPTDDAGVNSGCTSVVDQGSAGAWTFDGFKAIAIDPAITETFVFLSVNLAGALRGCKGGPFDRDPKYIDTDVMRRFIEKFPTIIRGIKAHGESGSWSNWGDVMLRRAREIADRMDLPMYVHTGQLFPVNEQNRPDPLSVLPQVLDYVRPGDLLAHCFSCRDDGILGERQKPCPELIEAVANGVRLDIGHGINFSFDTARRMMDAGLFPYTISTDLHGDFASHDNDTTLDYSLCGTMSKLLAMGFDLPFVIRATTQHPAEVLRLGTEIGTLKPGTRADITVLDVVVGDWTFKDSRKVELLGRQRLLPRLVVRNGRPITPTRRLLRDICEPERMTA